jgi:hypothetical protein
MQSMVTMNANEITNIFQGLMKSTLVFSSLMLFQKLKNQAHAGMAEQ